MRINVISIGKTKESYLKQGIELYLNRLKHYVKLSWEEIDPPKKWTKLPSNELKIVEGKAILEKTKNHPIYLLDEKGKSLSSRDFASWLGNLQHSSKEINLVIGGAFGFSEELYQVSAGKISLSKMTFSHQMIRLFLAEQIYRAYSILNNQKYHND
jgi:23S rRNA (pseudouridine1915-N3)-methyltransferase